MDIKNMEFSTFGYNLGILMESHGHNISSLSAALKVSAAAISRYLSEPTRVPNLKYVILISEFFSVSIDWLLGLSEKSGDVLSRESREIGSLYAAASDDDKLVINAVLQKYRKE